LVLAKTESCRAAKPAKPDATKTGKPDVVKRVKPGVVKEQCRAWEKGKAPRGKQQKNKTERGK
jgi:hypothetical protein